VIAQTVVFQTDYDKIELRRHVSDVIVITSLNSHQTNVTRFFYFGPLPIKIFGYAIVPAILSRMKDFAVDSKTVCLWLVHHSYDRAGIKTLCVYSSIEMLIH